MEEESLSNFDRTPCRALRAQERAQATNLSKRSVWFRLEWATAGWKVGLAERALLVANGASSNATDGPLMVRSRGSPEMANSSCVELLRPGI